jgi:putative tryptophan/tyrosine transport system substrate-binding protein
MKRRQFGAASGAAAFLLPFSARAQQPEKSYRVSYLALSSGEDATFAKPFIQRLQELGYSIGKNMVLEYRSAEGRPDRLAQLAAELMQTRPDVLVAGYGTLAAKAAAAATKTTPVVFTTVADPVGAGLVASLPRPGAKCHRGEWARPRNRRQAASSMEDLLPTNGPSRFS